MIINILIRRCFIYNSVPIYLIPKSQKTFIIRCMYSFSHFILRIEGLFV